MIFTGRAGPAAGGTDARRPERRRPGGRRPGGKHRVGAPGTATRYPAGPPARPGSRRPRHLRASRPPISAVRSAGLVVLLGAAAVSSWFAATGAAAFAQMTQP